MTDQPSARFKHTPSILAIIVLYKLSPEESPAFRSLRRCLERQPGAAARIAAVLYDNSPAAHIAPHVPFECHYRHDETNPGLARAYQYALERAQEAGVPWLLLLDQDTEFTAAYLNEALAATAELSGDTSTAAIIPKLVQEGILLSPHPPRYLYPKPPSFLNLHGKLPGTVKVYNSGSILRVSPRDSWRHPAELPAGLSGSRHLFAPLRGRRSRIPFTHRAYP